MSKSRVKRLSATMKPKQVDDKIAALEEQQIVITERLKELKEVQEFFKKQSDKIASD